MKILLTGAGGFIGHHVLDVLRFRKSDELVCPVRGLSEHRFPEYDRVQWVECDLTDIGAVHDLPDCEAVVNIASMSQVSDSLSFPGYFLRANVDLMTNVLQYARWKEVRRVIHLSTNEVRPIAGERNHQPRNPYGAAKAAQEDICSAFRESFGVPVTILSTRDVFGQHQQSWKMIPTIVNNIVTGKVTEIYGGPEAGRHWIHAANVGHGVKDILDMKEWPGAGNEYTACSQQFVSHIDLVQRIEKLVANGPAHVHFVPSDRPGHESASPGLPGRGTGPFGHVEHPVPFEMGLRNTVFQLLNP